MIKIVMRIARREWKLVLIPNVGGGRGGGEGGESVWVWFFFVAIGIFGFLLSILLALCNPKFIIRWLRMMGFCYLFFEKLKTNRKRVLFSIFEAL